MDNEAAFADLLPRPSPSHRYHHHPLPHVVGVHSSFSQLLSHFPSPLQVRRLSAMPVWDTLLAPRGRNGLNGWLVAKSRGRFPSRLQRPASRHFIPGPHTGARVCFRLSAPGSIGIWKCRSQSKRGATRASRPRDHATNVADSARLISVRELGRGVDGGCPREGLESAECRQGPGENQWACGVSGSVGWELRAEADDLQAAGGSSTILSISHCHAMLKRHQPMTTDDQ